MTCTVIPNGTGTAASKTIDITADGVTVTKPAVSGTGITVTISKAAGRHDISARAANIATLTGSSAAYTFGYGPAGMSLPVNQAASNDRFPLAASVAAPGSGTVTAKLQWRKAGTATWTDSTQSISVGTASGGQVGLTSGTVWTSSNDITGDDLRIPLLLDVQVCFTFSIGGEACSWDAASPHTIVRLPHAFGDGFPQAAAGPGQVALWTGEFNTTVADVAVPGLDGVLTIGRSHSTFDGPTDSVNGVFGPGWTADFEGTDAGAAGLTVIDNTSSSGTIALVDGDESLLVFRQPGGGVSLDPDGTYVPADDDTEGSGTKLVMNHAGGGTPTSWTMTLTDADDTVTTWKRDAVGVNTTWAPALVVEAGAVGQTTYSRDGQGRVSRILAPVPAGVSCTTLTAGCRALTIAYATSTTATAMIPGDYTGRVQKISLQAYDTATSAMVTKEVSVYKYDVNGLLVEQVDPRNSLAVGYSYAGTANFGDADPLRLASISPPGLKPITLAYDSSSYRLQTISRLNLSGSTSSRLASFVYGIDPSVTVSGLPDLQAATVANWGQRKAPTYAAAAFGPDRVPSGLTPGTVAASDWPYAGLGYTDALGYVVNTATYGAGSWQPTATDYDANGNVVRSLDARGLAAFRTDLATARTGTPGLTMSADPYATITRYNGDYTTGSFTTPAGMLVTDSWGPQRYAAITNGAVALVRPHTTVKYDEGAPSSGVDPLSLPYWLQTSSTTGAADPSTATTDPTVTVPADLETLASTKTGYDKVNAAVDPDTWALGLPTTTTTVVGGTSPDIVRYTRYDSEGRVIETRQPASTGSDAGTTNTVYYRAGTGSGETTCDGKPAWAGLPCLTTPAAAPNSGPTMPDTKVSSYGLLLTPTTVEETSGATTRTLNSTYEDDGRIQSVEVVSTLSGSTATPTTRTIYSPTTGLPTDTQSLNGATVTASTTTAYDDWGRPTTYTNSLGENTTTTYIAMGTDGAGQPAAITDPKGSATYSYGTDANAKAERRGLPTQLVIPGLGTFKAAYDAAGDMTTQTMPAGLRQDVTTDAAGQQTGLTYSGDVTESGATSTKPWLAWSQVRDITGRIREEWTPAGQAYTAGPGIAYDRDYTYDNAGRLTQVKDRTATASGSVLDPDSPETLAASCTTRNYAFDPNGNRTSLQQYPANSTDGTCQQSTGATTTTPSYDNADRTTVATGYTYDTLGRATTIPAADAPQSAAGDIAMTYYHTDAVRTMTQNGTTTKLTLDPNGRNLQTDTLPSGGGSATRTLIRHYTDTTDSPGWTQETLSGQATRYLGTLTAGLGAEVTTLGSTTTARLVLCNPHGDTAATVTLPASGNATAIDAWNDHTEYGDLAAGTSTPADDAKYGWLGSHERSSDSGTGLILMGARVYNPRTGRFTSPDPLFGGNENAYNYPNDPVNSADLDGRCNDRTWACIRKVLTSNEAYPTRNGVGKAKNMTFKAFLKSKGFGSSYVKTKAGYRSLLTGGNHCDWGADTGAAFNFLNACDVHDMGYELMRYFGIGGEARKGVDNLFYDDMKAECRSRGWNYRPTCFSGALVRWKAVSRYSQHYNYAAPGQ